MSDKALIVTGSSCGTGAATSKLAAARGYAACVNYRNNRATANAAVDEIKGAQTIIRLLSAETSFVTGTLIDAPGGK